MANMDYEKKNKRIVVFREVLCNLVSERDRARVREKERDKEKRERLSERERKSGTLQIKSFLS